LRKKRVKAVIDSLQPLFLPAKSVGTRQMGEPMNKFVTDLESALDGYALPAGQVHTYQGQALWVVDPSRQVWGRGYAGRDRRRGPSHGATASLPTAVRRGTGDDGRGLKPMRVPGMGQALGYRGCSSRTNRNCDEGGKRLKEAAAWTPPRAWRKQFGPRRWPFRTRWTTRAGAGRPTGRGRAWRFIVHAGGTPVIIRMEAQRPAPTSPWSKASYGMRPAGARRGRAHGMVRHVHSEGPYRLEGRDDGLEMVEPKRMALRTCLSPNRRRNG